MSKRGVEERNGDTDKRQTKNKKESSVRGRERRCFKDSYKLLTLLN